MSIATSFRRCLASSTLVLASVAAPLTAFAQQIPSYATAPYVSQDETIHGRIRSVDGAFNISVDDDRGFIDNVQLHQGTIINPTGLSLSPGMVVTILGENTGSSLAANEIDTPYSYAGPLPTPVYLGPGYWAPGFAYGYGPSFSLAIVFGGGGFSFEHRSFVGRPWDGHGYFGAAVGFNAARHVDVGHPVVGGPATRVPSGFADRAFAGGGSAHAGSYAPAAGRGGYAGYGGRPAYAAAARSGQAGRAMPAATRASRGGERGGGGQHGGGHAH